MATPPSTEPLRIATFKIGESDYERLERVAAEDDRSVSAVLRVAVRFYLEQREAERAA